MKNKIFVSIFNENHHYLKLFYLCLVIMFLFGLSQVRAEDTSVDKNRVLANNFLLKISTLLQSIKKAKKTIVHKIQQVKTQLENVKSIEDAEHYSTMLANYTEQLRSLNRREEKIKVFYEKIKFQVECINGTNQQEFCR